MKKKALSLLLTSAMVASLAACGSDSSGSGASDLTELKMVVNGTLTATVDNGQADFEAQ